MQRYFSSAGLPKYHDSLLVLKVRETGVTPTGRLRTRSAAAAITGTEPAPPLADTAGLSLLATLERGGLVKRVVPLAPSAALDSTRAAAPRRAGLTVALAATATHTGADRFNAGVCVVELERSRDTNELQDALARDPHVDFVSRVPVRYLLARRSPTAGPRTRAAARRRRASVPAPASLWNLRKIRWAQARAVPRFKEAQKIRVAVLDSGVDERHPDLESAIAAYVYAHPDTPTLSGVKDIIGHGTHVAGTIGALINNDVGINGVCKCRLHAWKIFTDTAEFANWQDGFVYFVDPVMYLRALADCLDQDMDVVNLSIGGPGEPDAQEQRLFDALIERGVTVVAAMGNEREDGSPISYPAAIPGVVAVGATNVNDSVTAFSNRGDHITLCAPGKAIWSTLPMYEGNSGFFAVPGPGGRPVKGRADRRETEYDAWDGTSMASPHVAAAAALVTARFGRMDNREMHRRLTRGVDRVPRMGGRDFHPDFGAGRLNLLKLLP